MKNGTGAIGAVSTRTSASTRSADLGTSPSAAVARNEREELICEAMPGIPLEQRMLLELAHREGLSGREIAEALAIGEHMVRSRLSRSRAALREQLQRLAACGPIPPIARPVLR